MHYALSTARHWSGVFNFLKFNHTQKRERKKHEKDMGTLCFDNHYQFFGQLIDRWIQRVLDQLSPTVN